MIQKINKTNDKKQIKEWTQMINQTRARSKNDKSNDKANEDQNERNMKN